MTTWEKFINNVPLRRIVVLLGIIGVLIAVRSMMSIILLTFIFCLLVVKLTGFVRRFIKIPAGIIVTVVYLLVILAMYLALTKYIPEFAHSSVNFIGQMVDFYSDPKNLPDDKTLHWLNDMVQQSHIMSQVKNGVGLIWHSITTVTTMGVTLFLSLMLSYFFTVE